MPSTCRRLCWSKNRIFDKSFSDCLLEVDAAVARLKAKGAARIVVAGVSQGAMGAFGYGATRDGLAGIIGMAPAADPVKMAKYPGLAGGIAKAKSLIASGQGDAPVELDDIITGGKEAAGENHRQHFHALPRSGGAHRHGPESRRPMCCPKRRRLYSGWPAARDPSQAHAPQAYSSLPGNPLNHYATVDADHGGTPDASGDAVIAWLKTLP